MQKNQEIKFKNFVWINLVNPNKQILDELAKKYSFHPLAIEDCLSNIQQPKIDDYENHLFMVFHLPRYIKRDSRTVSVELDVFLSNNYIVTIHNGELKPFNSLFDEYVDKKRTLSQDSSAYLLYEILNVNFSHCLKMLERIGDKLDRVEDRLYEDQSRTTLEEISVIALDIINFRRVIGPQRFFIRDLEAVKTKVISEALEIYYDDIGDKIERVWEMLNNYKEVSDVLQKTNESILTQRLNEVMKLLTIFSAIMLPLTVITGFYGMNIIGLPFANHSYAPEIITGILVLVIAAMLYYFNRKKWTR